MSKGRQKPTQKNFKYWTYQTDMRIKQIHSFHGDKIETQNFHGMQFCRFEEELSKNYIIQNYIDRFNSRLDPY